jgi:Flp pilus assembly protein TadG
MRKRRRSEHGAAAVEFALVFPLLVIILVGTVTSGLSYSRAIGVTNAVREGARFGATADATQGTWAADVIARTRESQFDDPSPYKTTVCVELVKIGTGTTIGPTCSTGAAGAIASADYPATPTGTAGTCVVKVVAKRPYKIEMVFFDLLSGNVTKGATARYERGTTC